ncbi:hypothetical protein Dimus_019102 [Dionaea muscipula]
MPSSRDHLSEPKAEGCSCFHCCGTILITAGLAAFFIWLMLRPSTPTTSIERLNVFALNTSSPNATSNNTIYFDLKLSNKNNDVGVYYDFLNLTFYYYYYSHNRSSRAPVISWNVGFPGFYQGHHKNTHRKGTLEAKGMMMMMDNWVAVAAAAANGSASLRAELATTLRYKIMFWRTRRHRLDLGADLGLNVKGSLVRRRKKGVKLISSGVGGRGARGCYLIGFLLLVLLHL